eukprot:SAG11_NODE_6412_length_1319_cov_1.127869_1_plen_37_part_01
MYEQKELNLLACRSQAQPVAAVPRTTHKPGTMITLDS